MQGVKKKTQILVIATLVNFVHGNPYIWTVFQPYVRKEYGLSLAMSSQPFTFIIGAFPVGNILGGILQHKFGSRATVLCGSLLMCAGFFLAAIAPQNMPWLISFGYGVLGGMGSGCAFSMLVAVPQEWFPDKRGLVTGITIGIIGISGVVMNPICDYLLAARGYRFSMLTVTAVYALLSFTGGWFIKTPSESHSAVRKQPEGTMEIIDARLEVTRQRQYSTRDMLKTKNFYLIASSMAFGVVAYVLTNPLMKSLGMERGLTDQMALAGVVAASVANIAGRFAAPWVSDKTGRKQMLLVLYGIVMVSILGLTAARGGLFVAFNSLISFTYGGFVSVFPVLTADCFGIKYQGMNFGAVMLGYGAISILCPYMMQILEPLGYGPNPAFVVAGIFCAVGILITCRIKSGKN